MNKTITVLSPLTVVLTIVFGIQLFVMCYPGYDFTRNIVGFTVNVLLCSGYTILCNVYSKKLMGVLSVVTPAFGVIVACGMLSNKEPEDQMIGKMFLIAYPVTQVLSLLLAFWLRKRYYTDRG